MYRAIGPRSLDLDATLRRVVRLTPGRFTLVERALGSHSIGGWVNPKTNHGGKKERKFLILSGLELRTFGLPNHKLFENIGTKLHDVNDTGGALPRHLLFRTVVSTIPFKQCWDNALLDNIASFQILSS